MTVAEFFQKNFPGTLKDPDGECVDVGRPGKPIGTCAVLRRRSLLTWHAVIPIAYCMVLAGQVCLCP